MHEYNVCQTIVDTAVGEIERAGEPRPILLKTKVVLGRLRQLVPEYLVFAYETLTKGTPAEGSALEISFRPIVFHCEKCGENTESDKPVFTCRQCGSALGEVIGGRELYVESLEVETRE
jgi:hydrogenase nickel incorporation protein HypA/HybF